MKPAKTILGGLALAAVLLSGCQQILGIDKLEKTAEAGVVFDTPKEEDCDDFCGLVDETCGPTSENASYAESSYCLGACKFMRRTPDRSEEGNTFDCRLKQVKLAKSLGMDNEDECRRAGIGGFGRCGSDCEGYCQIFGDVCSEFPELGRGETCVTECEKLLVDDRNAKQAFSSGSDTLQCRMAHVGAASVDPEAAMTHCQHSAFQPKANNLCFTPNCEDYCKLVNKVCTGDMQQYDNTDDCIAACKGGMALNPTMPQGAVESDFDSVVCRRYHLYNYIRTGGTHCEHGGPVGDGHCGRICPNYCTLVKAACTGNGYDEAFKSTDECLTDCAGLLSMTKQEIKDQADEHYNVAKGKTPGNNSSCRVYHTIKAFRTPGTSCPAALGKAAPCAAD